LELLEHMTVIGWDIGGVNTKAARVNGNAPLTARNDPFEIQRAPETLAARLQDIAAKLGAENSDVHAITMTAELSQIFRTKRDGVSYVLDAVERAFPAARTLIYTVDGRFLDPGAARDSPLLVAASNWTATASLVATLVRDAILIDVGTTTTDIIPIVSGLVAAVGRNDPERLLSGELLYLGAVRTPVEAIVHRVPLHDGLAGVSAESFALAGDIHLWRGDLSPEGYTAPTPDRRPPTREFAGERIARVVCADRELLDESDIDRIAAFVSDTMIARIAASIARVRERHPHLETAVIAGHGAFLARAAARRAGLHVAHDDRFAPGAPRAAGAEAAFAVARLLELWLKSRP
jgi:(4-(4-[2-(gamma-L-glutamylamino)ethyl]phenoxymethyl)furan-2-yl)methanamine synthase